MNSEFLALKVVLLCLLPLACTAPPDVGEQSDPVTTEVECPKGGDASEYLIVRYADGARVAVQDWEFRYTFGAQDAEPEFMTTYVPQTKKSRDLHLQEHVTERSITSTHEITLEANRIEKILFEWGWMKTVESTTGEPASEDQPIGQSDMLFRIVFFTNDGKSQVYEPERFEVSNAFLSSERFVFEKGINLTGKVQRGNTSSEFDLDLSFRKAPESKREQVEEIWFCAGSRRTE